jgi:hypothetical protein
MRTYLNHAHSIFLFVAHTPDLLVMGRYVDPMLQLHSQWYNNTILFICMLSSPNYYKDMTALQPLPLHTTHETMHDHVVHITLNLYSCLPVQR